MPEIPKPGVIARALKDIRDTAGLLHMDYRQANLRTEKGEIVAIVDWSNALVGHPALELARIAEIGETGNEFLRGYASVSPLPNINMLVETIFRLDTATMLALVFLSEEPNPKKAPIAISRVRELHTKLGVELGAS